MNARKTQWQTVTHLLRDASTLLSSPRTPKRAAGAHAGALQGSLEEFDMFLENNELELAWDALRAVGSRSRQSGDFWTKMALAAGLMGSPEKVQAALSATLRPRAASRPRRRSVGR